ncbi:hypothetical protein, partial [Luteolibacter marinus]|uniref:hypothetical protein n=1 Tax=Luteolibacter marinus TaxID=2776705 RepID=UPI002106B989
MDDLQVMTGCQCLSHVVQERPDFPLAPNAVKGVTKVVSLKELLRPAHRDGRVLDFNGVGQYFD